MNKIKNIMAVLVLFMIVFIAKGCFYYHDRDYYHGRPGYYQDHHQDRDHDNDRGREERR